MKLPSGRSASYAGGALLLAGSAVVQAASCQLDIASNDRMQYDKRELSIPADCRRVELTLHNTGSAPVGMMGHDWVLARESDMQAVLDAGRNAGPAHGYLPEGDQRVIAATRLLGAGQSATVRIDVEKLDHQVRYAFFCTFPAHSLTMRGRLVFAPEAGPGSNPRVASASPAGESGNH